MQILRGGGPRRRRPFLPFRYNAKLGRKHIRLRRLMAKGLTPAGDKATLQALADDATSGRIPRKV